MPKMIDDKQMKRGDCQFLFSGNTMAWKWMDNRSVMLLLSALEGMDDILSVQRREKGSKTNSSVPFPKVVKLGSSGMVRVDLLDQRTAAYRLNWKSSVRFYLHIFFDLMDIACASSYLIYNMKHPKELSLLPKNLIQHHQDWERKVPMSRLSTKKNQPESIDKHGGHLPDHQKMWKQGAYYSKAFKENRTFVIGLARNIPLAFQ